MCLNTKISDKEIDVITSLSVSSHHFPNTSSRYVKHTLVNIKLLQQMVLRKLDIHMQENGIRPISSTLLKNHIKDLKLKSETETSRRNHRQYRT